MIEQLEIWDRALFLKLNAIHSPFWDQLMLFVSGKIEWAPLYLILLIFLIKHYKKQTWWLLLAIALTIVLCDQISVKVFKEGFERFRPCHNLNLKDVVHLVNNKCGGKFGFVSSHATNTFGLATLVGLLLRRKMKTRIFVFLLIWASIVSYSRIYLGVHYPADVIGGGLVGMSIGLSLFLAVKYTLFIKNEI